MVLLLTRTRLPRSFPLHNQRRRYASSFIPRMLLRSLRLPALLGAAGAGTATVVSLKMDEVADWFRSDWMRSAKQHVDDLLDGAERHLSAVDLNSYVTSLSEKLASVRRSDADKVQTTFSSEAVHAIVDAAWVPHHKEKGVQEEPLRVVEKKAEEDATRPSPIRARDGQFTVLTKKLIEIRNLLKEVDSGDNIAMQLPSIVVIGSQSSGKSSVLEAIVGHQFLPKGTNMVTRRPIELTLIHEPELDDEYGEFPQLGLGKIRDFAQIQRTLTDLNRAVSDEECVSDVPIELQIHSPNVPDLTLVDLPGYIQVTSKRQPPALKHKIRDLCEKYIREPNIILAVCAADVDLANSEALRSCRRADPLGLRTIGVVTKLDLVSTEQGMSILENTDYPLLLGYVGVMAKTPKGITSKNEGALIAKAASEEESFFRRQYLGHRPDLQLGTSTLRKKLTRVLEEYMSRNLTGLVDAVQSELDEAKYQYKVQYNDRRVSAEAYLAETVDLVKQQFRDLSRQFAKNELRAVIRAMLEQRSLDLCSQLYWSDDPNVLDLPDSGARARGDDNDVRWKHKLDIGQSLLTKSGVGRACTQLVVDTLRSNVAHITELKRLGYHEPARRKLMTLADEILRHRFQITVNQVENTIKPYKYEVDCSEQEWAQAAKRAEKLVEKELQSCEANIDEIRTAIGKRKLKAALKFLLDKDKNANATEKSVDHDVNQDEETIEDVFRPVFSQHVLDKARETMALRRRALILRYRLAALRSRACRNMSNRTRCPEIHFNVIVEKLAQTATMFIQVELLNEFYYQFPREVDDKLYYGMGKAEVASFARENADIQKQLDLANRKAKLQEVAEKLAYLSRGGEDSGLR